MAELRNVIVEHYIELETWLPPTVIALTIVWIAVARSLAIPIEAYLVAATSPDKKQRPLRDDARARVAYRAAQTLPYKLALAKMIISVAGETIIADVAARVAGRTFRVG